jgi:hypothetical protein
VQDKLKLSLRVEIVDRTELQPPRDPASSVGHGNELTRSRPKLISQPANGDFHRFSEPRGIYETIQPFFCVQFDQNDPK